jgi:glycosyltransferase involved in cell wall biosynthesis
VKVVYAVSVPRGGPLTHVLDLAPRIAARGVQVQVLGPTGEPARQLREAGVEVHALPLRHKLDLRGAAAIWPHLRGADIVHTHDRRTGLLVRPQARSRRTISVHTFHGLPDEIFARVGRPDAPDPPDVSRLRIAWLLHGLLRIEALLSLLGTVVVPSHALAEFLVAHGFPRRRLHVIPNGITVSTSSPSSRTAPLRVGTSAMLDYRKGVDVLMEAAGKASAPFRLDIFGDGSERPRLEGRAAELGLDAHFHGYVDDLPARLRELDVFVLPTRADNFPMAILEAMAASLPVIATRVGGIPEIVVDGETGLLVPPEDAGALAAALDRLVQDGGERARLGEAGAARAAAKFDSDSVAGRMVSLYEGLCASST